MVAGRTVVVWQDDPEVMVSQEFQYLRNFLGVQIFRAFGDFEEASLASMSEASEVDPPDRVVLVGSARVLLTQHSLRVMDDLLTTGFDVVVASRLEETSIVTQGPIHTLREFELAETAFLAEEREGKSIPSSRVPLSLWRGDQIGALLGCADVASGELRWETLTETQGLRVRRGGLCHEFTDYYGEIREDVLPHMPAGANDVLEIGCGRGHTGALLQKRLGCRVTGVELNPLIAREASRRLHRVVCGDFEQLELNEDFDAVVATELFEHLVDPIAFLKRVRSLLRPGGRAVISTPNVGHWSTVGDLLHGRWDYLPIGLLCYTHLRFFTRSTLTDLLDMAGFESFSIEAQKSDVPADVVEWVTQVKGDLESLATTGFWILADN